MHNLKRISLDFSLIFGLNFDIFTFLDMYNNNKTIHDIMEYQPDERKQPGEVEEEMEYGYLPGDVAGHPAFEQAGDVAAPYYGGYHEYNAADYVEAQVYACRPAGVYGGAYRGYDRRKARADVGAEHYEYSHVQADEVAAGKRYDYCGDGGRRLHYARECKPQKEEHGDLPSECGLAVAYCGEHVYYGVAHLARGFGEGTDGEGHGVQPDEYHAETCKDEAYALVLFLF